MVTVHTHHDAEGRTYSIPQLDERTCHRCEPAVRACRPRHNDANLPGLNNNQPLSRKIQKYAPHCAHKYTTVSCVYSHRQHNVEPMPTTGRPSRADSSYSTTRPTQRHANHIGTMKVFTEKTNTKAPFATGIMTHITLP